MLFSCSHHFTKLTHKWRLIRDCWKRSALLVREFAWFLLKQFFLCVPGPLPKPSRLTRPHRPSLPFIIRTWTTFLRCPLSSQPRSHREFNPKAMDLQNPPSLSEEALGQDLIATTEPPSMEDDALVVPAPKSKCNYRVASGVLHMACGFG